MTPTSFSRASCEIGPSVAMPTPRPSTTMLRQAGSRWKPTPSGPTMLRLSPFSSVASPRVPRPTHLYKNSMRLALAVDAIDALRAAEKQFADVGRRAEQVEELARRDSQRLGRSLDDEMLVFGIYPVVEHHRAQRLFGRDMCGRRRRAWARFCRRHRDRTQTAHLSSIIQFRCSCRHPSSPRDK